MIEKKKYCMREDLIQTFFEVRKIVDVESKSFDPPPKVQSSVIKLIRNDVLNIGVEFSFFKTVVKSSFQRRRKILRNALKNLNLQDKFHHDIFSKRAEELSSDDFIWLSKYLKN